MGELRPREWYDAAYARSDAYRLSAAQAPWATLWRATLQRVPDGARVLDIGCGPGHLAELWAADGRDGVWCGVDFSEVAIVAARRRAPRAEFVCADVFSDGGELLDGDFTCFVATEFLEHVDDDLGLLARLPPDREVVVTLPSKDSAGHVRHFNSMAQVRARYERAIEIEEAVRIDQWFLVAGHTPACRSRGASC